MAKRKLYLCSRVVVILVGVCICYAHVWAIEKQEEKNISPITETFLKLYADPEPEISLGAMLLSAHAGFPDSKPLVAYIKKSRSKNETSTERTIKNYAIAWLQYGNDTAANLIFVKEFSDNIEDFRGLMHFEQKFKSPPSSYLLEALLFFANGVPESEVDNEAVKKKARLIEIAGDWGWIASQLEGSEKLD